MPKSTVQQIVDSARKLVQLRGYNAFSYADISDRVGIRKASIHYHFPSKGDLGRKLVEQYRATFHRRLVRIEASTDDPMQRLAQYVGLYREGVRDRRLCLCGMLAADYLTLPQSVRAEVSEFFAEQEAWLALTIDQGCQAGQLHCRTSADVEAQVLLSGLHGAQLTARTARDGMAHFEAIAQQLLQQLVVN